MKKIWVGLGAGAGILLFGLVSVLRFASIYDNTYSLQGVYQEMEGKSFVGSVAQFQGENTMWSCYAEQEMDVNIEALFSMAEGSLELVQVRPDGSRVKLGSYSAGADETAPAVTTIHLPRGENRLKIIAGEDVRFDWNMIIEEGQFMDL